MVTIKEIARQAGVSTTTVSNVLHKKNARVSAETIEKVERLLAENNYIPRLGLNALTNRSSRIICILITTPKFARGSAYETPFYGNMLGHLERLLREKGYYIMIFSDKNVEEIEKMTVGWNVDGIITISMPYRHLKKRNTYDAIIGNRKVRGDGKSRKFVGVGLAVGVGLEDIVSSVFNGVAVTVENSGTVAAVWLGQGD